MNLCINFPYVYLTLQQNPNYLPFPPPFLPNYPPSFPTSLSCFIIASLPINGWERMKVEVSLLFVEVLLSSFFSGLLLSSLHVFCCILPQFEEDERVVVGLVRLKLVVVFTLFVGGTFGKLK